MKRSGRKQRLYAAVFAVSLTVGFAVGVAHAQTTNPPFNKRFVLQTRDGEMEGVISGCPVFQTGLILASHDYVRETKVYVANSQEPIGFLADGRHNHSRQADTPEKTPITLDRCFTEGMDEMPGTVMEVTLVLPTGDGIDARIRINAKGTTRVHREGVQPGSKAAAGIELVDTVLTGTTDAGVPVTIRVGKGFGLPPSKGTVRRVSKPPFPDFATIRARVNAEIIVGPPEKVSIGITPAGQNQNRHTRDELDVAILSTKDFNATTKVDRRYLTFGPVGNETDLLSCSTKDFDQDRQMDVVCSVSVERSGFELSGSQTAVLRGLTVDGQPIEGQAKLIFTENGTLAAAPEAGPRHSH